MGYLLQYPPSIGEVLLAIFISILPLLIFISIFNPEDDGAWLGSVGFTLIMMIRDIKELIKK